MTELDVHVCNVEDRAKGEEGKQKNRNNCVLVAKVY